MHAADYLTPTSDISTDFFVGKLIGKFFINKVVILHRRNRFINKTVKCCCNFSEQTYDLGRCCKVTCSVNRFFLIFHAHL
jgi:hypothetical protein